MHTLFQLENAEGKRPLGKPRYKWKYNIRMDLREIESESVYWIHLT